MALVKTNAFSRHSIIIWGSDQWVPIASQTFGSHFVWLEKNEIQWFMTGQKKYLLKLKLAADELHGLEFECRGHERLRVIRFRCREDLLGWAPLDDLTIFHNNQFVG